MHDLSFIVAGYAATAAMIVGYRLRLAARTRRARRYVSVLTGRPTSGRH